MQLAKRLMVQERCLELGRGPAGVRREAGVGARNQIQEAGLQLARKGEEAETGPSKGRATEAREGEECVEGGP